MSNISVQRHLQPISKNLAQSYIHILKHSNTSINIFDLFLIEICLIFIIFLIVIRSIIDDLIVLIIQGSVYKEFCLTYETERN